ncbi:MAG: dephospho-CoA kinase [Cyanobacteria bacterium]|nr:dephospho-CoA kinase [Cyanobacteriota bacterium]MDW8200855.1 dephospho-CoA kinase [Cyanobacteriota bacterium SKYGB_h_bin112]
MTQRQIGLTGGIGMGKTTVSNYMASQYGIPVLDADVYARDAVAIGSPILERISDRYGQAILLPDGNLNRAQLGTIVFADANERRWLEQQIHPYVRDRFAQSLAALTTTPLVVLSIPLLFEAGLTDMVSEIWVVTCRPDQQLQRLIARGMTIAQAQARISSQLPIAEKIAHANIVLDNSGTLETLYRQIDHALAVSNR